MKLKCNLYTCYRVKKLTTPKNMVMTLKWTVLLYILFLCIQYYNKIKYYHFTF